jgi:MoaA/NifB/PqqE/SkfB family radical SAM enzyme
MSFPPRLSFTVTNACNLRCRMCGQWSDTGYVRYGGATRRDMALADWKRLVDEGAEHGVSFVLVRGGEPFLFPGIIELLEYLLAKGIATAVDTNGAGEERPRSGLLLTRVASRTVGALMLQVVRREAAVYRKMGLLS